MEKSKGAGHRGRMYECCVVINKLLSENDRISISEIADRLGVCTHTVRRWLDAFSMGMDLRIEKGIVIIERH